MIATALSSYFVLGAIYWFPPLLAHVVLCPGQPTIFANGVGRLLPIRVHNDSVPIVCVHFVRLHSSSALPV